MEKADATSKKKQFLKPRLKGLWSILVSPFAIIQLTDPTIPVIVPTKLGGATLGVFSY